MRRKSTKEYLAESFRELAETNPIDKITVQDIVKNCEYSTATFYRHFKDKYDLIAWSQTRSVAAIMDGIGKDGYTWEQALLAGAQLYDTDREYYTNLFLHTGGQDSFIQYMTEINFEAIKKQCLRLSGETELDEKTQMYIRIYSLGASHLTCEWILGKYKISAEEFAQIYINAVPAPLRKYFH